jgi:hypothetical protein
MTAVGSLKVHYTASRGYHVSAKCDADGVCLCVFSLFPIALFLRITRARARERECYSLVLMHRVSFFVMLRIIKFYYCNNQNYKFFLF